MVSELRSGLPDQEDVVSCPALSCLGRWFLYLSTSTRVLYVRITISDFLTHLGYETGIRFPNPDILDTRLGRRFLSTYLPSHAYSC